MADSQRLSPLAEEPAHVGAPEAGIVMRQIPLRAMAILRGDSGNPAFLSGVREITGCDLPVEPCRAAMTADDAVLWMGPDEWLVVAPPNVGSDLTQGLRDRLGDSHWAVVEVSDALAMISVGGPRARDLLAKGCTLDLHPRAFGPGHCANTLLSKAQVTLHQIDAAPTFSIYVAHSFAVYLWRWLLDAGLEYGVQVLQD
jgi:sarcosine oxidase subunit gamma